NHETLAARGVTADAVAAIERALPSAQHLRYVLTPWLLDGMAMPDDADVLSFLGFDEDDIEAANIHACGALTLEGAPHLHPDHLSVFDGLQLAGTAAIRRVSPLAQLRMQAAVETFLSG